MNKKIIAVALALLIMTVAFVGCGNDSAEQSTTTTVPAGSTTETTKDLGADVPDWIVDDDTTTTTTVSGEGDTGVPEGTTSASGETTTKGGGIEIGGDRNQSGHVEYTDIPILNK